MRQLFVFLLIFTVLGLSTGFADEPLEYKLAVIDSEGYVSHSDAKVARFKSLLQQLSGKFIESQQRIADMTVATQDRLREFGIRESLLSLMEGMNNLFYTKNSGLQYGEQIAAYITCRRNGMTRSEAITGLRSILKSFGAE